MCLQRGTREGGWAQRFNSRRQQTAEATERGDKQMTVSPRRGGGKQTAWEEVCRVHEREGTQRNGEKEASVRYSANSNSRPSQSESETFLNFLRWPSVTR